MCRLFGAMGVSNGIAGCKSTDVASLLFETGVAGARTDGERHTSGGGAAQISHRAVGMVYKSPQCMVGTCFRACRLWVKIACLGARGRLLRCKANAGQEFWILSGLQEDGVRLEQRLVYSGGWLNTLFQ